MKITTGRLKEIIKEELMREMGEAMVVDLFPFKVMPKGEEGEDYAAAMFKDLDAAVATAKVWKLSGLLSDEGTSPEVLDHEDIQALDREERYEDEERAIKRAGPSPQMTPEEHGDYMSLYPPDED